VGAQYREACRARSVAEFISKLESAAQELDETTYWMDLLVGSKMVSEMKLAPLQCESNELMAIFVASVRTAKRNKGNR
jgi:four helix bundle protein